MSDFVSPESSQDQGEDYFSPSDAPIISNNFDRITKIYEIEDQDPFKCEPGKPGHAFCGDLIKQALHMIGLKPEDAPDLIFRHQIPGMNMPYGWIDMTVVDPLDKQSKWTYAVTLQSARQVGQVILPIEATYFPKRK